MEIWSLAFVSTEGGRMQILGCFSKRAEAKIKIMGTGAFYICINGPYTDSRASLLGSLCSRGVFL